MLYGTVKRETDRAWLFSIKGDHGCNGDCRFDQAWLPKKCCSLLERALGPLDGIKVPAWLIEARNSGN